jgi:UPF0271 protein
MAPKTVDINCDLGEGTSIDDCLQDALLMPFISRCNIACGGHAGNTLTMQKTLENADKYGVLCGAHPGYPDPDNFGRVSLNINIEDLLTSVLTQITQLQVIANSNQQRLTHIKLHGALYNDAENSAELANALCAEFAKHYPNLGVIGLSGGEMQTAAMQHQLRFLKEGFMDRAYLQTGHLVPRSVEGSVYTQTQTCIEQVFAMLNQLPIKTLTISNAPTQSKSKTQSVLIKADTICLHGDSSMALALAQNLQQKLSQKGYKIA